MSNGFLSQEEIDSLLNGGNSAEDNSKPEMDELLSEIEIDLIGEIGNISMGSASTALSTIISQTVNITTPIVSITTLSELKDSFEVPNVALEVKYTSGIIGENVLVLKIMDAAVIANLMMGGDGKIPEGTTDLSEIEISAVSEAMNQMIGSSATSMATMFGREVNISPPTSKIWNDLTSPLADGFDDNEPVVKVSFSLIIGDLVDSHMMQVLPIHTAKKICSIMMGEEKEETQIYSVNEPKVSKHSEHMSYEEQAISYHNDEPMYYEKPAEMQRIEEKPRPMVEVNKANFQQLSPVMGGTSHKNIDLILDVPLEISVVLGRTKKNIKDILNIGTGSLIQLDKLTEEPVEILVNGKKIAYGEVVVVDENFGVRITSIVSSDERIKSLSY